MELPADFSEVQRVPLLRRTITDACCVVDLYAAYFDDKDFAEAHVARIVDGTGLEGSLPKREGVLRKARYRHRYQNCG
jgi:hypothetical protein